MVVHPASHQISRVRWYSRAHRTRPALASPTGLSPAPAARSSSLQLPGLYSREESAASSQCAVQPPRRSASRLLSRQGFGLLPVRSPLLRESFLFLAVLRCFSSRTYPGLRSPPARDGVSPPPGCPIRTSLAHRLPAP